MEGKRCPSCEAEIIRINTSKTVILVLDPNGWARTEDDMYETFSCPECGEEFSPAELDTLEVPNNLR